MNKQNIRLRALTITDIEKTLAWHNQEDISDLYSGHPFPVNIEMEKKWYEKILTSNIPVTVLGIEVLEDKNLIGITVLKDIDLINRTAEIGCYIGDPDQRGKGFAYEASIQTIAFGFYKIGLNRIYAKTIEENVAAIKTLNKMGLIKEGVLRNSAFKNNSYKNVIVMSILKDEFNG